MKRKVKGLDSVEGLPVWIDLHKLSWYIINRTADVEAFRWKHSRMREVLRVLFQRYGGSPLHIVYEAAVLVSGCMIFLLVLVG